MGQMAHEPYTLESYVLTTGWMFACFVLAASFTAELASFLAAEKEQALASFGAVTCCCRSAFSLLSLVLLMLSRRFGGWLWFLFAAVTAWF